MVECAVILKHLHRELNVTPLIGATSVVGGRGEEKCGESIKEDRE